MKVSGSLNGKISTMFLMVLSYFVLAAERRLGS